MRQRKRVEWSLSVYQYWVRLEYQTWAHLPDAVKQEITALRTLWNQLVDAFTQQHAAYHEIFTQLPHLAELQEQVKVLQLHFQQRDASLKTARHRFQRRNHPELAACQEARSQAHKVLREAKADLRKAQHEARERLRPALRQLQASFLVEARRLTAECPATWASKEFLVTHFLAAIGRFFKQQNGPPKLKPEVPQAVHLHHRFTGGGLPVERLFGRGQRVHLQLVPPEAFHLGLPQRQRKRLARTTGTFRVGDTTLSFVTILHRPLPQGAYLKAATLVGRQVVRKGYTHQQDGGHVIPARWRWSLHLTLEIPPYVPLIQEEEKPIAVLDLHSQAREADHLRIGVLLDSTGREEALVLPEKVLFAWQHKRVLQSKAEQLVGETKTLLRRAQLSGFPAAARRMLDHLEAVRAPGLWRLLQVLEESGVTGETLEILQRWADRSTRLLREARGLERRYLGHRDWFYRNLARQLCQRYRQLVVKVPALRVRPSPDMTPPDRGGTKAPLQEAATYRQLVALSRFLGYLQQAAVKAGSELSQDPVQRG